MNTLIGVSKHLFALEKQLNFWHSKSGDGFYKFLAPCEHPFYRKGDSWCEEIKVSENTLRKYMKTLCCAYGSKKAYLEKLDPFEGKPFASYFDRLRKISFYFRNPNFKMEKVEEGRGVQKKLSSRCVPTCVSINTDKNNNSLYPPKSPLGQKQKKEVGSSNPLDFKKEGRGDLDEKAWEQAKAMHANWVEATQGAIPTPKLTNKFALKLLAALKERFKNSLEVWSDYCRCVASSDFLMGKVGSFKAWLVWVIREDTVAKIKAGALGIKRLFVFAAEKVAIKKEEVVAKIEASAESAIQKAARKKVLGKVGVLAYRSWFEALEFKEGGGVVAIGAPNPFVQAKIEERFGEMLREMFGERA